MPQCSFKSCKNNYRKTNLSVGVSYFRYPSNPFTCAKWTSIVARERRDDFYKPAKNSVICSDHFDKVNISGNTNRRRLAKNAIPILQIQSPSQDLSVSDPNVMTTAKQIITRPKTIDSSDTSSDSGDELPPTLDSEDDSLISEPSSTELSQRKTTKRKADSKKISAEPKTTQQKEDYSSDLPSVCGDDHPPTLDFEDDECGRFQCNECLSEISGFRYTCVQCTDWDLCANCDKRGAHAHHFVLRVPRGCNFTKAKMVKETVFNSLILLFQNQAEADSADTIIELKEEVIDEENDNNSDGDFSMYAESALIEKEVKISYRSLDAVLNPIKTEDAEADDSLFIASEESRPSKKTKTKQDIPDTDQHEPLTTSGAPRRQHVSISQIIPIVQKTVPPNCDSIAKKSMSVNSSEENPIARDDDIVTQPREGARYIVVDCGMPVLGASKCKVKPETTEPTNDDLDDLIVQSKIRKLS